MVLLMEIAALSPTVHALEHLVGSVAKVALCLAAAYLALGIAYMAADYFAGRQNAPCRYFRRFFRTLVYIIILFISGLHALEYVLMANATA